MRRTSLQHLIFCICYGCFISRVNGGQNEKALLAHLFNISRQDAHNPLERPVVNERDALEVCFKVTLQQIIDVDEKNQIVTTNMWLDEKWIDYHFKWNPFHYNNITSINVPAWKVWKPDILMYNSADDKFDGTFPTNVVVNYDGSMLYVPPGMFKSTCQIDITWYPFDTQNCDLKFGSWTFDSSGIDFKLQCPTEGPPNPNCSVRGHGDTTNFILNGEWTLQSLTANLNRKRYNCCPNDYLDITFNLKIKRRILYYLVNIVLPCVILSCLCVVCFIIPADSGEKISFGVTILLSMTVFLLLVAETMPPTSDAVPLIGLYFGCIMILCSLSVGATVLVLNIHNRTANSHPDMSYYMEIFMCKWLPRFLCMNSTEINKNYDTLKTNLRDIPLTTTENLFRNRVGDNKTKQQLLIYPNGNERRSHNIPQTTSQKYVSRSLIANVLDIEEDSNLLPYKLPNYSQKSRNHIGGVCNVEKIESCQTTHLCSSNDKLSSVLRELQTITTKIKQDEEDEKITSRWKFVSRVIDRLCLILFLGLTLVTSGVILLSPPGVIRPETST